VASFNKIPALSTEWYLVTRYKC